MGLYVHGVMVGSRCLAGGVDIIKVESIWHDR
jgi:hypothetical protein